MIAKYVVIQNCIYYIVIDSIYYMQFLILYSFDIHSKGCNSVGAVHTDLTLVVSYNSFGYGKTETEMTAGAMS